MDGSADEEGASWVGMEEDWKGGSADQVEELIFRDHSAV
jgi:hypothetical protein